MTESVGRLAASQDSPEHGELARLSHTWLELCHQAGTLEGHRQQDLLRSRDYHRCISAMEALFELVSVAWDNLAR